MPHSTLSIEQQATVSKQILGKTPTELRYADKSIFMKDLKSRNPWTFESKSHGGVNVPISNIEGLEQIDRQSSQNLNNDNFHRPLVTSAQCIMGTEKYPDVRKN